MDITKRNVDPPSQYRDYEFYRDGSLLTYTTRYTEGMSDVISYAVGPQYSAGRLNWKPCEHVRINGRRPMPSVQVIDGRYRAIMRMPSPDKPSGQPPHITQDMIDEATQKVVSQFDLNCSDSVLLYSGILQAVPLVGGCFKFVSIMNKAARTLSRSFKRQPFTTVVKTMISLDFIDRFVVKPTIDDARKFLDAHNYVMRVMNTLNERNQEPVALSASVGQEQYRSVSSFSSYVSSDRGVIFRGEDERLQSSIVKLFTLAKLDYTGPVDPVQLWATRMGLNRPLESVWDLVPFSFVIDYFTRAGDFVSALSDEMSSQDGLRARLGKVLGQWICTTSQNIVKRTVRKLDHVGSGRLVGSAPMEAISGEVRFSRYPVSFAQLNSGLLSSDSDLIHWNLTNRRAGTLAELFIQAKL